MHKQALIVLAKLSAVGSALFIGGLLISSAQMRRGGTPVRQATASPVPTHKLDAIDVPPPETGWPEREFPDPGAFDSTLLYSSKSFVPVDGTLSDEILNRGNFPILPEHLFPSRMSENERRTSEVD